MCDIFMPEEFGDMFRNQHIIILGRQVDKGVDRQRERTEKRGRQIETQTGRHSKNPVSFSKHIISKKYKLISLKLVYKQYELITMTMLFPGGSQMRGLYKDMVWLLNHPSTIPNEVLGAKSENRFPDMEKTEWKVQHQKK